MKVKHWMIPAALTSLIACGADDEPTAEDYNDVAQAVAPLVVGDGGDSAAMESATAAAQGQTPAGLTRQGSGSLTGERGGLNYSYSIECRASDGVVQATCDDTTDSASVEVDWDGTLNTARYTTSVQRSGTWTLTGIQGATALLDGVGDYNLESEFQSLDGNRQRTYMLSYNAIYESVTIDTATRRATGGNASFAIAAERTASNQFRDVEASFNIDAELIFNGDGSVRLVLDGERVYSLDSVNGAARAQSVEF